MMWWVSRHFCSVECGSGTGRRGGGAEVEMEMGGMLGYSWQGLIRSWVLVG